MCFALYLASDRELPVVQYPDYPEEVLSSPAWPRQAQRLSTEPLAAGDDCIRSHFTLPHVLYAGSYEGCSCGFCFCSEYPPDESRPEHLTAARESVAQLVRYIREAGVRELYLCWMGEESQPTLYRRSVPLEEFAQDDFFFRQQELLTIEQTRSAVSPPLPLSLHNLISYRFVPTK